MTIAQHSTGTAVKVLESLFRGFGGGTGIAAVLGLVLTASCSSSSDNNEAAGGSATAMSGQAGKAATTAANVAGSAVTATGGAATVGAAGATIMASAGTIAGAGASTRPAGGSGGVLVGAAGTTTMVPSSGGKTSGGASGATAIGNGGSVVGSGGVASTVGGTGVAVSGTGNVALAGAAGSIGVAGAAGASAHQPYIDFSDSDCNQCMKKYCDGGITDPDEAYTTDQNLVPPCDNLTGTAGDGPAAGASKKQLCLDLYQCIDDARCLQASPSPSGSWSVDPKPCYCGTASGTACVAKGAANGPCRAEYEAALEFSSLDNPELISQRIGDTTLAGGWVTLLFNGCAAACASEGKCVLH